MVKLTRNALSSEVLRQDPRCRTLLAATPSADASAAAEPAVWHCPRCQGVMQVFEFLTALQIRCEQARQVAVLDSS